MEKIKKIKHIAQMGKLASGDMKGLIDFILRKPLKIQAKLDLEIFRAKNDGLIYVKVIKIEPLGEEEDAEESQDPN